MRAYERHVVVGASGTGKTVTGKAIAAYLLARRREQGERQRLVCFDPAYGDPEKQWHPKGARVCRDRQTYLEALRDAAYPILVRAPFCDWSPLEELTDLLVVVDEAHRYARPRLIHPSFSVLCREASHRGTDLIVLSQRPADLDGAIWANPTKVWIHPLFYAPDREAVERGLGLSLRGRTWAPALTKEGPHPRARLPLVYPDDFAS